MDLTILGSQIKAKRLLEAKPDEPGIAENTSKLEERTSSGGRSRVMWPGKASISVLLANQGKRYEKGTAHQQNHCGRETVNHYQRGDTIADGVAGGETKGMPLLSTDQ